MTILKEMKIFILAVALLNSVNLCCQHTEGFLSMTLDSDWMVENGINEIIEKVRWANIKGKLKGRQRARYSYSDSLGFQFLSSDNYEEEYRYTDTSTIRCQKYENRVDQCRESIYSKDQLIRTKDYWSTKYYNYDTDDRLISIWSDNSPSFDNGQDHILLYHYNEFGRLGSITQISFLGYRTGNQTSSYKDFDIKNIIQTNLIYSDENYLEEVIIYKGENENTLNVNRILEYQYNDLNLPWKTYFYDCQEGVKILESESEYVYIYEK